MQVGAVQLESCVTFYSAFTSPWTFPLSILTMGMFVAEMAGEVVEDLSKVVLAHLKLLWSPITSAYSDHSVNTEVYQIYGN